jgi:single-stranded-DNA-specific exonuclease
VVRRAAELGIDVIVTDHHLPEAELPPAVAVLNPNRRDCGYPEKNLCGAGVTFKLVQALLGSLSWPPEKLRRVCQSFLKLVALATVADVVPLTGENRIIVKHGLAGLADVRNPGLRALLDVAGFGGPALPTASQVAFRIAPRINAAGRMATATEVIEMFLTADAERARAIAERLHAWNAERQQTEMEIVEAILSECEQAPVGDDQAGLVFCGAGWHRGVLGIVASRLVDRFHRPVIVLGEEGGIAQGSGRSIPQFHLLSALEAMPELILRFGGHAAAAGLTLGAENVARFRHRFNQFALSALTAADFVPVVEIDAVLNLAELTDRSVAGVLSLAPFGCGNPAPLFAALDVEIAGPPAIWAEKHVRVALRHNGRTVVAKAWGFAERLPELAPGSRADVALTVQDDAYSASRGYPGWCLVIRDVRPAAASAAA